MSEESNYDETALLEEAKGGNLKAYNKLVKNNMNKVYAMALRLTRHKEDAEDVVQQTFVSVIRNLKSFRGESAFSTWLLRIAINNALKILKKKSRLQSFKVERQEEGDDWNSISLTNERPPTWNQSPEELLRNEELRSRINHSLTRLDAKHRPVFVLRDMEGLSTKEVAQILEISESNVKIRLMRSRIIVRKALGDL